MKSINSFKNKDSQTFNKIKDRISLIAEREINEFLARLNSTDSKKMKPIDIPHLPHETEAEHRDTNDIMWNAFRVKFESFLDLHINELKTIINNSIEKNYPQLLYDNHNLEQLHGRIEAWNLVEMKRVLLQITDPQEIFHEDNHCECLLRRTVEERDKQFFKYLQSNIMWIYDPCFVRRIWIADLTKDATFFSEFSKSISTYMKNGTVHRGGYHHMRTALFELNRIGILDLESGADKEDLDDDWNLALEIMRSICEEIVGFNNVPYLTYPKKFKEAFSKSFSKYPGNVLKYSHPLGGNKILVRSLPKNILNSKRSK